jgi:eukaryotic-like serine/threonine-protein kinase
VEPPDYIGRYPLLRRIARGRATEIFVAGAVGAAGFQRRVVIKRLLPEIASNGDEVRRFFAEAHALGALHHPNIVSIHELGEDRGDFFMVLDLIEGCNLRSMLATAAQRRIVPPLEVPLNIAYSMACALQHAHKRGFVHREIAPTNILLDTGGGATLIDFGSAGTGRVQRATRYAPPELIAGGAVDERSDIYSLGVLLYEMTTGRRLFASRTPSQQILSGRVRPPAEVRAGYPVALQEVVLRAIHRDPHQRFQTAASFAAAIEGAASAAGCCFCTGAVARFLVGAFDRRGKKAAGSRGTVMDDDDTAERGGRSVSVSRAIRGAPLIGFDGQGRASAPTDAVHPRRGLSAGRRE